MPKFIQMRSMLENGRLISECYFGPFGSETSAELFLMKVRKIMLMYEKTKLIFSAIVVIRMKKKVEEGKVSIKPESFIGFGISITPEVFLKQPSGAFSF